MGRRRNPYAELATPVTVGALTALVAAVAMFLSYNANRGLPFVPTYNMTITLRDAQELIPGNNVMVSGHRVGVIDSVNPELDEDGNPEAQVAVRLNVDLKGKVRRDATARPRLASPLGLKYLELNLGKRGKPLPEGGVLPLSQSRKFVDLDEVINELDAKTRRHLRRVLGGFGDAFASRGADFNDALFEFRPLLRDAEPVLSDLADPDTRLGAFVRGLAAVSAEVAPASGELVALLRNGETTLAALEAAGPELEAGLERLPGTLATGTESLATLRPVFARARRLTSLVRPGFRLLPSTTNRVADSLETGTPVLRRSLRLAGDLDTALAELRRLSAHLPTLSVLRRLSDNLPTARRAVEFLAPYQTVCNYLGVLERNFPSALSEGNAGGNWLRFDVVSEPAEAFHSAEPSSRLHFNPYPNGAAPGQPRECEGGNEPYLPGQRIGNVPGNQGTRTDDTDRSGR